MADNATRLQAGKLRQRIAIVEPTGAQDSTGGFNLSDYYTPVVGSWADVEDLDGSEQLAGQSETSVVRIQITMRYMDGIDSTQQVLFDNRKFQITSVLNADHRNKKLVLNCVEINGGQQ